MLSIGEFSRICGVTTRTLRYYDKINLIKPAHIELESGYRSYVLGQLREMLFINRLKSYDFSLDEIAILLSVRDNDYLMQQICRKKQELHDKAEHYKNLEASLEFDLANLQKGVDIMSFIDDIEVQLIETPAQYILHSRQTMGIDDYGKYIGKLFGIAAKEKYQVSGAPISIYHAKEFDPQANDTEIALPVAAPNRYTRILAGGLCVTTICKGPYAKLSEAYCKGIEWLQQNGYTLVAPPYEQYQNGPDTEKSPDNFVTQIYFPVKQAKV
jgi:DNA-binding transcriptional MerR regulator